MTEPGGQVARPLDRVALSCEETMLHPSEALLGQAKCARYFVRDGQGATDC